MVDRIDLRDDFRTIHSQRGLLSCMAICLCDLMWWELRFGSDEPREFDPAVQFVYYNARKRTGNQNSNIAVAPSEAMAAMTEFGVCSNQLWPYRAGVYRERPTPEAYQAARKEAGWTFRTVPQTLNEIRDHLTSRTPFLFCLRFSASNGWSFEGGEIAKTGRLMLPQEGERPLRNHAMLAVGFDDRLQTVIARNSYGSGWGDAGHVHIPYRYLTDTGMSYSFWRIVRPGEGE